MVGFYLASDLSNSSRVTFGGYAEDLVKKGEQIKWYPLVAKKGKFNQWQHTILDLQFDGSSIYSKKYNISVFNTASAKMIFPKEEFDNMVSKLNKKFTANEFSCEYQNNVCSFNLTCEKVQKLLKPMSIRFGDDWYFNIPSKDYLYTAIDE